MDFLVSWSLKPALRPFRGRGFVLAGRGMWSHRAVVAEIGDTFDRASLRVASDVNTERFRRSPHVRRGFSVEMLLRSS